VRILVRGDGTRVVASEGDRKFFHVEGLPIVDEISPFEAFRRIAGALDPASLDEPDEDAGYPVDPEIGFRAMLVLHHLSSGAPEVGVMGTVGCAAPLRDLIVGEPVGTTAMRVANPGSDVDLIVRDQEYLYGIVEIGFEVEGEAGDRVILSPIGLGFRVPKVEVRVRGNGPWPKKASNGSSTLRRPDPS